MVEVDEILEPLLILGVPQVLNGSLTTNGQLISTRLPLYTYGEQPNPWDVPEFTRIGYDPVCLTGSGATTFLHPDSYQDLTSAYNAAGGVSKMTAAEFQANMPRRVYQNTL